MRPRTFLKTIAFNTIAAAALLTGAGGTFLSTAAAQGAVEVPFYYPVAVGGPIAKVIDGFAVNGSASVVGFTAGLVRKLQSGYLYHYAFAMILGLVALLALANHYWL